MAGSVGLQPDRDRDQAAFYRAALLLGLLRGDVVVRWADAKLARESDPSPALVELSTTDPTDITTLRHGLLELWRLSTHADANDVLLRS